MPKNVPARGESVSTPPKILIVDDEPLLEILVKQKFKKQIANKEFVFIFADNGADALQKFQEDPEICIVLTDINMPVMDGLTLLENLLKIKQDRSVQTVVISAYGDMRNIRMAMNRGASDFIVKPIDLQDLEATLFKTIDQYKSMESINKELRRKIRLFNQFVPSQFLRVLNLHKDVDHIELGQYSQCEVSVLFADLFSFTEISESLSDTEIFERIHEFFSAIIPYIIKNNGFIDKFIGDAFMALFQDPDNCLQAAIEIQNNLNENSKEGSFNKLGIGINSGPVVLGTLGSKEHMETTVMGDVVNIAARTEKLTRIYKTPLIITSETRNKLKHSERYSLRRIDNPLLKGKSQRIEIYEVLDALPYEIKDQLLKSLDIFNMARQKLNEERIAEAKELFLQCLEICPQDEVSRLHLSRLETFATLRSEF
jgi:class 3 adenylate cyclase/ActR/RegA family two-component response regulator